MSMGFTLRIPQMWLAAVAADEWTHQTNRRSVAVFPFSTWATVTLWLFNIAMENDQFFDGLPIKNGDFPWLCMLNNQMVCGNNN